MSYELLRYDPYMNDNRGGTHHYGYFHSKERAQDMADGLNRELLRKKNTKAQIEHQNWQANLERSVKLNNALFAAGLRDKALTFEPKEFVPKTDLVTTRPDGHRGWFWKDVHYFVEELEYEDD